MRDCYSIGTAIKLSFGEKWRIVRQPLSAWHGMDGDSVQEETSLALATTSLFTFIIN